MSRIVIARQLSIDATFITYLSGSGEKSATPPKASHDTSKLKAAVSTNSDEPKSLWSKIKQIFVDAWHKIIKVILEGK